jgi:hypothetical protein
MKNLFSKQPPKPKFDLYIVLGKGHSTVIWRKDESLPYTPRIHHPAHWMLVLTLKVKTGTKCTWYYMKRGATGYELSIKEEKSLSMLEPIAQQLAKLASLTEQQCTDLREYMQTIEPKRCQDFVLDSLGHLAVDGVIEEGVVEHYKERSQKSVLTQMKEGPWELPSAPVIASMLKECWQYAQQHELGLLTYDTCLE